MRTQAIVTESYFDGTRHHDCGPYTIGVVDGRLEEIRPGDRSSELAARCRSEGGDALEVLRVPFVMPGLVEAHAHLFLDGAELDFQARQNHLKAPREAMLAVGRRSLRQHLEAGITLVRDAGDLHGINTQLKAESSASRPDLPEIISAGRALRKAGGYGSFMAIEATDAASIVRVLHELAPTADQLKILLTGIIDFERGQMKGGVQFDLSETRLIVRTARDLGRRTFAHCSGPDGLKLAVEAGLDCIEHGFFMERDILCAMADRRIAWVPTFSPVYFQYEHPERAGWNAQTVAGLWRILEQHFEHVALAAELGVPILAGSDAGSYGVAHGHGLVDELFLLRRAGLPLAAVLESATSLPRRVWNCTPAAVQAGHRANLIALAGSPFVEMENLRRVQWVMCAGSHGPSEVTVINKAPCGERSPVPDAQAQNLLAPAQS
ncbi:MAG: amidohydrolase family protein [Verrucomicrobia bacterium]|nr:amidohydrolase family protein [Verrucomicrobiota bacterium]